MDIDYFDEDFCKDDVEEMTEDEKEVAAADLQAQIWDNEEQNDILKENLKLLGGEIE